MHNEGIMQHLTDDDLVLHYYGELDTAAEAHVATHLSACESCHRSYVRLQRVMAAIDTMPVPALGEGYERTVWARLEPELAGRRGWSWLVLSPANLGWAAAVLVLVAGAFFAGRMTPHRHTADAQAASAEQIREGVLLADVGEHLDRSQAMLVELVNADASGDGVDVTVERENAEELVAANRLYRQAASANGDVALGQLLDELERLLVELAASPDKLPGEDLERVQQRITAKDLLFKVRIVSSAVKDRQKQQTQSRAGVGQSSLRAGTPQHRNHSSDDRETDDTTHSDDCTGSGGSARHWHGVRADGSVDAGQALRAHDSGQAIRAGHAGQAADRGDDPRPHDPCRHDADRRDADRRGRGAGERSSDAGRRAHLDDRRRGHAGRSRAARGDRRPRRRSAGPQGRCGGSRPHP
jgi:hypothetical protein